MYFKEIFVNPKCFSIVKKEDLDLFINECKKVDSCNFMYYKDDLMLVGFVQGKNLIVDLKEVKNNG